MDEAEAEREFPGESAAERKEWLGLNSVIFELVG